MFILSVNMSDLVGEPFIGHVDIDPYVSGKIALFDADYLKYTVTYEVWKKSEGKEYFVDAIPILKKKLENIFRYIGDPMIFCFSGKSSKTFRYQISFEREYKGNRKRIEDPYHYDRKLQDQLAILEYCQKEYVSLMFPDLEADDIISALQDHQTYIVSNDKDLKTVPGWHFSFTERKEVHVSDVQAMTNLAYQIMTGDATDNIRGIPGVGTKTAEYIIESTSPKHLFHKVLSMFHKKYNSIFKGTDAFCEMYMLVKLRENRGDWFQQKYEQMFNIKQGIIDLQKKKIGL